MAALQDYTWHFAKRFGGEDTADSAVGKFFKDPFGSLVRESIQNSLDVAVDDNKPVEMVYRINCLDLTDDSKFFDLEKYVKGSLSMFKKGRAFDNLQNMLKFIESLRESKKLYYMEVSDSNTKGMDYETDNDSTRFYSFAKCLGNSDKSSKTSGGSYGFGKIVFYNASKLRSILVSTMTPEGQCLFEGIASLSTSKIDGQKYEKTGYFCMLDDEEPTSDAAKIPLGFTRACPGTSVYVMGIDPNVEHHAGIYDSIKRAAVENFWLSILGGKLTVTIGDDFISSENIDKIAEQIYENGEAGARTGFNPIPFIDAVKSAGTDTKHVLVKDTIPILGDVRLYLSKNKKANDRVLFMRKTQMLIKSELNGTSYGFYGVFVCDGEKGNEILRSSEDPTHTEWKSTNCDTDEDRHLARKAISELNKFLHDRIVERFGGANSTSSDITGAQNYLFMNTAYEEQEDGDNEVEYGDKTDGTTEEETGSPISTLEKPGKITKPEPRIGIVNIEVQATASPGEGDLERGKSDKPVDPVPTPAPPMPYNPNQGYKDDPNGTPGHFSRQIPVKYHFYFQNEEDGLYHYVIVTSENEIEDCTLVLTAMGDYGKESEENRIFVVYSDSGDLHNGVINKLHLNAGKTTVKVKFEDNLKHSVNLKAYENK